MFRGKNIPCTSAQAERIVVQQTPNCCRAHDWYQSSSFFTKSKNSGARGRPLKSGGSALWVVFPALTIMSLPVAAGSPLVWCLGSHPLSVPLKAPCSVSLEVDFSGLYQWTSLSSGSLLGSTIGKHLQGLKAKGKWSWGSILTLLTLSLSGQCTWVASLYQTPQLLSGDLLG